MMNSRLTSYQLQDFAEEDGNSVFSDPDYVVASPLLLVPPNVIVHSIRKSERCLITMVGYSLSAVRRLLTSIFFYVINDIHVPAYDNVITTQHRHSADRIFLEFSNALAVDNGCHRTVAYYADKQCVSPKYLSKIVKQYTGKPAIGIILEHAVDKIRAELKYTDIPIKEVAERFGFDDYASFCKFVKTHIGCSPQNCRNS